MKGYDKFPAHWETMSIKRIFDCVSGNGFKIELQGKLQGDYPFCKVSDLNGEERDIKKAKFYVDVQTVRQERFNIVPEWSILFAKIGEALKKNHRKINLVPCCIDNNCAALIVRNNNFSVKYGYYVMKCIDMACFDNGGTIPYVDMKQLMIYKIPVPPRCEQDQIARFLDWKIT
ncbi:MAG: restriction endonuclease subunit S [Synergistaceae bacterium]|nr:restriction endonuclease subunit S [Synergistaceae bacterium]